VPTGVTVRFNVRYGSLADIRERIRDVRFAPKNGHPVLTSTSCHVAVGSSPTATTNGPRIAANVPEDMVVAAGQKLAVIRTTTSGVLHVTDEERCGIRDTTARMAIR
jgi:hypothetical protein